MKIIKQTHEILSLTDQGLTLLEKAGRTCYKSEDKIT
jgi:thymidylate synthase (FAD)